MHGDSRPYYVAAELHVFAGRLRLDGECPLQMSGFGIDPVTALGSTIRLKDEIHVCFDIAAAPEAA
jgi:hypothetical protein